MPSPPIQVFLTTIASQPALRQKQEYLLRILQVKKIPFKSYDLASDEDAKRLWRRKAPTDKQQLPGILVGGKFPGTISDFEEAVEFDELNTFLRLNESYDPSVEEDRPLLEEKVIGVPGVSPNASPLGKARSSAPSPSPSPLHGKVNIPSTPKTPLPPNAPPPTPVNRRDEVDVGSELVGFGLQGVKVTDDELRQLVEELGLGEDEAGDLVKGLGFSETIPEEPEHNNLANATVPDNTHQDTKE
ncbi:hypothetical protein PUNSTDRAFT_95643 [Punctularia strigosozonata HHB-11173 SS5]|uniref:uncharacterized protein n=1 Tax=Punctularia strigosozonata (strain HHB-11173) TaxID=741275 RepID=UPI00044175D4|nr:uncharacterized protein PUNSTDRAFT_95643 [Punctularia strigosozonata HHB-11173 SS5]EIN14087.1 hypothetical protein PUNSTDRAFT_95643 [Punctularia strigosozonata HHB-11173 SS5]